MTDVLLVGIFLVLVFIAWVVSRKWRQEWQDRRDTKALHKMLNDIHNSKQ